jgi:hypothetical protein
MLLFFEYRNVAKTSEFADNYEVTSQIKKIVREPYILKAFENYRAFRLWFGKANLKN